METINYNGKTYRCVRPSEHPNDFGRWDFFYKDQWHEVVSFGIRSELNNLQYKLKDKSWVKDQEELFKNQLQEDAENIAFKADEGSTLDLIWKGEYNNCTCTTFSSPPKEINGEFICTNCNRRIGASEGNGA